MNKKTKIESLHSKKNRILQTINKTGGFRQGFISTWYCTCGKPYCHCVKGYSERYEPPRIDIGVVEEKTSQRQSQLRESTRRSSR